MLQPVPLSLYNYSHGGRYPHAAPWSKVRGGDLELLTRPTRNFCCICGEESVLFHGATRQSETPISSAQSLVAPIVGRSIFAFYFYFLGLIDLCQQNGRKSSARYVWFGGGASVERRISLSTSKNSYRPGLGTGCRQDFPNDLIPPVEAMQCKFTTPMYRHIRHGRQA